MKSLVSAFNSTDLKLSMWFIFLTEPSNSPND
uniref:Uncharacterized protein n=1 Tax=Rhizophora mucronata TaxID=61149 RepID=A0A2P2N690_RHIMU